MNNGEQFFNTSAAGGYAIERSLRFNSADSAYLSRTPGSAGNRKTWTWAGWVKPSEIPNTTARYLFQALSGSSRTTIKFESDNLYLDVIGGSSSLVTTQVFRDPSAWYHIVAVVDTTDATSSNRAKLYVNGVQVTAFSTATYPSQNADTYVNSTTAHYIGAYDSSFNHFNGYLADVHFIDGQALDPTSFGEFDDNGIWQPIDASGLTYGTNGFHLDFADNSTAAALGTDTSPNGNDWTVNNISVASGAGNDSVVDVPTNGTETDTGVGAQVRGNYCTWNPLDNGGVTLSNGNLDTSFSTTARAVLATFGMSSGKWYWEGAVTSSGSNHVGIAKAAVSKTTYPGGDANGWSHGLNGYKYNSGSGAVYGSSFSVNDVIGVAFDADNGTLTFYKNGVSEGTAYTGLTSGPYFPIAGTNGLGSGPTLCMVYNFGQRPFAYTAPSGFKALNTANLPAPVVTKPSEYMDVKVWTGNGTSQNISGFEFSPDFVWIKQRSTVEHHALYDIIRGATNQLYSNLTNAETTQATTMTAFLTDGFSVGSDDKVNELNQSHVAWVWDAGSSTVTNNDGSISSQVRSNGYLSIVTYTGTGSAGSFGHGLNVSPGLVIIKKRTGNMATGYWTVYHSGFPSVGFMELNLTAAFGADTTKFSSAPSSTVVNIGSNSNVNENGQDYVAYCFAPVAGYSSAFSYSGNGSSDGPMVYLGFRPRWILLKRTDTSGDWVLHDTARDAYNVGDKTLYPNLSDAEFTVARLDELSNGFKLRSTSVTTNASGGTYIGFAFAESPFQYARAR